MLGGLALWRCTQGVELPVVSLPKVGVLFMCLGAAEVLLGLYRVVRGRAQRSPPGTHSTSPVSLLAIRARMNSRSERRLR
ncbi:DUF5708 family protein [Streptomyces sp. NPDC101219]|uniref:DUF5708 family protein n=1 Tax=Streptomyces sp. NPDC101219 TaxID=3366131 RepID=UPI0038008FB1